MSLLLVSGAGGAGTTTVAAALAQACRDAGRTTAEVNSAVAPSLNSSSVWADARATFGSWLADLGAEALTADELAGLSGIADLVTGALVAEAAQSPDVDVVVWDMGSFREAARTLQVLDSIPMLLDRLLTGSVAAQLSAREPRELTAAWHRLVQHAVTARDVTRSSAAAVLVGRAQDVEAIDRAAGVMRLFECVPAAVVLNRMPKEVEDKAQRALLKSAVRSVEAIGAPVVQLPDRAAGAPRVARSAARLAPLARALGTVSMKSASPWEVVKVGSGYDLRLELRANADVQVARRGDALLVVCDGSRRQFELPPVIKRCLVNGGGLRGSVLVLHFTPDPRMWRAEP